jgi:lipoate-protein ligase A
VPRHRVWTCRAPAIVLGCSQRALHDEMRACLPDGVALLRRDSGGGAVLTGPWMVSASVALPADHAWVRGGVVESYRAIGELHAAVLAGFGVTATLLPPAEAAAANAARACVDWACFGSLSPWEVVDARGRKLVGLAQRRRREAVLLVAGTLVVPPDWALLCAAAGQPKDEASLRALTASCADVVGSAVRVDDFAAALDHRLSRALAVCLPGGDPGGVLR